jgi:hypothetical protein
VPPEIDKSFLVLFFKKERFFFTRAFRAAMKFDAQGIDSH